MHASAAVTAVRRPSVMVKQLGQIHDELTECPVCLSPFDVPKLLPCMHTVCLHCLGEMFERQAAAAASVAAASAAAVRPRRQRLSCPLCRRDFDAPPGGLDNLPRNFVVDRLVDLLRSASISSAEPPPPRPSSSSSSSTKPSEYKPHPKLVYTRAITIRPPDDFELPVPGKSATITGPPPAAAAGASKRAPPLDFTKKSTSGFSTSIDDATPPPATPSVVKPFRDVNVFERVDTHAEEVSEESHPSFRDLVWHLIYARDITNEMDKARAVFRWLCTKDLGRLKVDGRADGIKADASPDEVLLNLQQRKTTYAAVFEILCTNAGLKCRTIRGKCKGDGYQPGERLQLVR